jgi:hypothetical protein
VTAAVAWLVEHQCAILAAGAILIAVAAVLTRGRR